MRDLVAENESLVRNYAKKSALVSIVSLAALSVVLTLMISNDISGYPVAFPFIFAVLAAVFAFASVKVLVIPPVRRTIDRNGPAAVDEVNWRREIHERLAGWLPGQAARGDSASGRNLDARSRPVDERRNRRFAHSIWCSLPGSELFRKSFEGRERPDSFSDDAIVPARKVWI
jgi:hypothetical protein